MFFGIGLLFAGEKKNVMQNAELSEQSAELFSYYFFEAQRCFDMQEYDECMVLLDYCLSINDQDAECHSLMGLLYGAMKATDISLYHMQRASELAPTEWRYSKNYASALYTGDDNSKTKALEVIKKAAKDDPDNVDIWETMAVIYNDRRDFKNQIKCLDQIERIEGRMPNTTFDKYKAYVYLGKEKKGIEEIESYIKEYPEEYRMQCVRGNIYLAEGDYDKAYEIYQRTLEEHPENPFIYTSLAEYYTKTGNTEQATRTTIEALQSKHLDLSGKVSVLQENSTILENNETDIEPLLQNMIEQYPLEELVHSLYAQYLHNHGRYAEEQSVLQTMTDINPSNEQTWERMIDYAIDEHNDSLFAEITDKAILSQPDKAIWYFYKSLCLMRDSAYSEAKVTSEKGLSLATDKELNIKLSFYRQLGDINTVLGQLDEVYANYESALSLAPNDVYVLNNYAYMLAIHGGDLKKAEKMSAKTIETEPTNSTYLDTYAWILYLQGSKTLAKFYIDRAKEYAPEGYDIHEIEEHYNIIYSEL